MKMPRVPAAVRCVKGWEKLFRKSPEWSTPLAALSSALFHMTLQSEKHVVKVGKRGSAHAAWSHFSESLNRKRAPAWLRSFPRTREEMIEGLSDYIAGTDDTGERGDVARYVVRYVVAHSDITRQALLLEVCQLQGEDYPDATMNGIALLVHDHFSGELMEQIQTRRR